MCIHVCCATTLACLTLLCVLAARLGDWIMVAHCQQAIWENQFYYLFGFLFLVAVVLTLACAEITVVFIYMQLCAEVCLF